MQSKEIIATLKMEDAKSFIASYLHSDLSVLGLAHSGKTRFNITVCLQLMAVYKKAKYKLPIFVDNLLAIDARSYEQATSQKIAEYKQQFISGESLLDLTAGIGVDSLFLSPNFKKVVAVERNKELHDLAVYNLRKLGIENITRVCGDAKDYLNKEVDWVYIDPDRRPGEKRAVKLENLEPNVLELLPTLKLNCAMAYIKLSPLFDVDEIWRVFADAEKIVVLAENNEIKEVGVILNFKTKAISRTILLADVATGFSFKSDGDEQFMHKVINNKNYFMVPNVLLTKSRLIDIYLSNLNVERHPDFGYYFSEVLRIDEGYRTFKVISEMGFNSTDIKSSLDSLGTKQVNIIIKGLNDKPAKWHSKLKTRDGGNVYLFLLKGKSKQALLVELISS